jgi:hypothetical protein
LLIPFLDDLNLHALELLREADDRAGLFLLKAGLELGDQRGQLNVDTVLLGVAVGKLETQLLDADLALGQFALAQNEAEGNATVLGSLELLLEFGLLLVVEFGLCIG